MFTPVWCVFVWPDTPKIVAASSRNRWIQQNTHTHSIQRHAAVQTRKCANLTSSTSIEVKWIKARIAHKQIANRSSKFHADVDLVEMWYGSANKILNWRHFFCLFIILAKLLSILIKRRRALIARNCVVRCPAAAVQIKRAIPHP